MNGRSGASDFEQVFHGLSSGFARGHCGALGTSNDVDGAGLLLAALHNGSGHVELFELKEGELAVY
jgi:hypothetical protein